MEKLSRYLAILLFSGILNSYAIAETAKINVYFQPDSSSSPSNFSVSSVNFNCTGKAPGYSYSHAGAYDVNKKFFSFYVAGQFDGDKRKDCTIYVNKSNELSYNTDTYFIIGKFAINFVYDGKPYTCTINQKFGTNFDTIGRDYDALEAEFPNKIFDCSDKYQDYYFKYEIEPGQSPSPGEIKIIAVKNYETVDINIDLPGKASQAQIISYNMSCTGISNTYYVTEKSISVQYDTKNLKLSVDGPFDMDQRGTCTLQNHSESPYFTVKDINIKFNLNDGSGTHYCLKLPDNATLKEKNFLFTS